MYTISETIALLPELALRIAINAKFFKLGIEQSDDLLQKIKTVENPNFQDDNGISYLYSAYQSHYLEVIKLLLTGRL